MKRTVVVLTITVSVLTVLYHIGSQGSLTSKDSRLAPVTLSLDSSPVLQFQKPARSAIANIDVWNLRPFAPMPNLKDMFKPTYALVKNGRMHSLRRSDRPNESWSLQGIVMRGSRPMALMYNSGLKKMKSAGAGDIVDDQLIVKSIGSGSVTLEAKDGKKPQRFELQLFKTEKDNYAIKKKNL
jgi:hypothetical protein